MNSMEQFTESEKTPSLEELVESLKINKADYPAAWHSVFDSIERNAQKVLQTSQDIHTSEVIGVLEDGVRYLSEKMRDTKEDEVYMERLRTLLYELKIQQDFDWRLIFSETELDVKTSRAFDKVSSQLNECTDSEIQNFKKDIVQKIVDREYRNRIDFFEVIFQKIKTQLSLEEVRHIEQALAQKRQESQKLRERLEEMRKRRVEKGNS